MHESSKFSRCPPVLPVRPVDSICPSAWEVVSHCGFDFYFPNDTEPLFTRLLAICAPSWRNVYSTPLPVFKMGYHLFTVDPGEIFTYSGYWPLL